VHVKNTTTLTFKEDIFSVLSNYNLDIQNIKGQVYGNVGNICEEWDGLQALFTKYCSYSYYVHCLTILCLSFHFFYNLPTIMILYGINDILLIERESARWRCF